jgi:hypothetical protein
MRWTVVISLRAPHRPAASFPDASARPLKRCASLVVCAGVTSSHHDAPVCPGRAHRVGLEIIGVSSPTSSPIDIACRPWPSLGSIDLPSGLSGRPVNPSIFGMLGP